MPSAELPPVATAAVLLASCALAFAIRLFPVVNWGSVIHEFDPQFNYRVTKFLAQDGIYELLNWFDDRSWYPLGRVVGTTLYPGLMLAAAGIHWGVGFFTRIDLNVRHACVLVTPVFAAFSCVAIFLLTRDVTRNSLTALLAAALIAISPAYISRSTAGSFDNEGVAIFLLIFTFYLWVKAVRTGSMLFSAFAALSYFAMAFSWGGYVFIINVIPIHVVALLFSRNYSTRVYVAYSTFYPIAMLLSMQVPFIGFNAVLKAEAAASHGVFLLLQGFALLHWISGEISQNDFTKLVRLIAIVGVAVVATGLVAAMALGKLQWSGRSLTLLDPTYASKYIPIIASVGEHQPTTWAAFYFSLGPSMLFVPLGIYYSFQTPNSGFIFMIVYSVFAFYFAGVMVRLLLTLAPAACFLSAVGISNFLDKISVLLRSGEASKPAEPTAPTESNSSLKRRKFAKVPAATKKSPPAEKIPSAKKEDDSTSLFTAALRFENLPSVEAKGPNKVSRTIGLLLIACCFLLVVQVRHSATASNKAFSSTQLVYVKRNMTDGTKAVHDDYREAYAWLRANTPEDATILSWWDYGYQISTFANRTVLVDNNTWNNTHIATVGRVLASSEEDALPILRSLGVDYVLVLFGGKIGMGGDDLDKLPWIIRITEGVFPDAVLESEFQINGRYTHHANATLAMTESLAYKLSYYEFNKVLDKSSTGNSTLGGMDVSRKIRISQQDIELRHLEHAFTTESWIMRIFRVKKD